MKINELKRQFADAAFEKFAKRFWSKVKKGPGCWEWQAPTFLSSPYGQIKLPGMGRSIGPHRASWLLHFGEIPEGLAVLHRCDNPKCVRIDHLSLGTQLENIADMHRKGRGRAATGDEHGHSKLTADTVRQLRERYAHGGVTVRQLAAEHGVTNGAMWQALSGATWKSVPNN